jgi:hypothetical protein
MKRIDLSIEIQDTEIVDRGITAYTSKHYPGLAIHRAWSRLPGEWEVTHIQSGRSIAHLPSKAAAKAALPLLCKFSDWSGRATDIVPADPGEYRWFKAAIAAIVKKASRAA